MIARGLRVRSRSVTDLPRPVFLVSGDAKFLTVGGGAPVCAITLTGDIASVVGAGVPDIDGQSFSVTDAVTGLYLASSPLAALRPMPESGKIVWIEGSGYSISAPFGSSAGVGFTGIDALGEPIATAYVRLKNGSFQMEMERPAGTRVAADNEIMPSQSGGFSVGIGGDGQVYFYLRSAGEVRNASTIDPLFADVFVGVETLLITGAVIVDTGGTGTGGATIVTNQSGMTDRAALAATGTGEDWCGNPIGAAPQAIFLTVSE